MKSVVSLLSLFVAFNALGKVSADSPVLQLPEDAALKFNGPFVITSMSSRAGSPVQSIVVTAKFNLKDSDRESLWSQMTFAAAIKKLKTLKNFDKLHKVMCFVDFKAEIDQDIDIPKGHLLKFKTPDAYGTPTKSTQIGNRLYIDTGHDSILSASFEKDGRRLYCSFTAGPDFGWGTDFVSDLTLGQLEVLLSPYFDLVY